MKRFVEMASVLSVLLSACATKQDSLNRTMLRQVQEAQARGQLASAEPQIVADPASASLWIGAGNNAYIFKNGKAQRIGDLVTVLIEESSKASSKGATETKKDATFEGSVAGKVDLGKFLSAATKNNFKGEGTTDRSGSLQARLTAVIEAVLPNGTFYIKGSKSVEVSNEEQIVTLTGFVRPDDVRIDNTVLSSYVADAEISYSGSGVVSEKQRPGWLTRVLDYVWPF